MTIKIVIAGTRCFDKYDEAENFIQECLCKYKPFDSIIMSGGCSGADRIGEIFAKKNGFEIERYPAEWHRFGRAAGPKRNQTMAEKCDAVICFWDGKSKGSASMIEYAKRYKKTVFIKQI